MRALVEMTAGRVPVASLAKDVRVEHQAGVNTVQVRLLLRRQEQPKPNPDAL